MIISIATHQGTLYNDTVDYIVVKNQDGEFAIMNDHTPIICVINEGYVKLVLDNNEAYVAVCNGVLEFHNNYVNVLAQEAQIGKTASSAIQHIHDERNERLEINRKESSDYAQMERELRENLKNAKAGSL